MKHTLESFKRKLYVSNLFIESRSELGPCLLWTGSVRSDGYGRLHIERVEVIAHRWYYEQLHGSLESFLQLDHLCRHKTCCNDFHLEPVTGQTNTLRGIGPSSVNAAKTHCPQGHEYDQWNTLLNCYNERVCKECRRVRRRAYYLQKGK